MVDKSDTSNDCLEILDLGWIYEPLKNASTDSPARCRVKILQAVLDA
jgi:hypothetical protein